MSPLSVDSSTFRPNQIDRCRVRLRSIRLACMARMGPSGIKVTLPADEPQLITKQAPIQEKIFRGAAHELISMASPRVFTRLPIRLQTFCPLVSSKFKGALIYLRGRNRRCSRKEQAMDSTAEGYSAADERTKIAYKNRWKTLMNNPKILVIALFASYVCPSCGLPPHLD